VAAFIVVEDLAIDPKHKATIGQRWEVWTKGYCLYGEVNGQLYVYTTESV